MHADGLQFTQHVNTYLFIKRFKFKYYANKERRKTRQTCSKMINEIGKII